MEGDKWGQEGWRGDGAAGRPRSGQEQGLHGGAEQGRGGGSGSALRLEKGGQREAEKRGTVASWERGPPRLPPSPAAVH